MSHAGSRRSTVIDTPQETHRWTASSSSSSFPSATAGVEVSEPYHFGAEGQANGLHPERASYGTYLSFADPDGNGWLVQEVNERNPDR